MSKVDDIFDDAGRKLGRKNNIRLAYNGTELQRGRLLHEYNIQNHASFDELDRLYGGNDDFVHNNGESNSSIFTYMLYAAIIMIPLLLTVVGAYCFINGVSLADLDEAIG